MDTDQKKEEEAKAQLLEQLCRGLPEDSPLTISSLGIGRALSKQTIRKNIDMLYQIACEGDAYLERQKKKKEQAG